MGFPSAFASNACERIMHYRPMYRKRHRASDNASQESMTSRRALSDCGRALFTEMRCGSVGAFASCHCRRLSCVNSHSFCGAFQSSFADCTRAVVGRSCPYAASQFGITGEVLSPPAAQMKHCRSHSRTRMLPTLLPWLALPPVPEPFSP